MNSYQSTMASQTLPFRKLRTSLLILASLLMSLATHAQDYTYDALNRLTIVTTPDGHQQSYHYDAAGNLLSVTTSDLPRVTDCLLYAVHDDGRSDSQLFSLNPYQNFAVNLLGEIHRHYDIEALDIDPTTDQLFAGAGADGLAPGALYTINPHTGDLTLVGASGFSNLHGISFRPDGSLWGWASGAGLIQLDPHTGQGTLIMPSEGSIEDITWDHDGLILYVVGHQNLWAYHSQTQTLTKLSCPLPTGKIEALERLPDGRLLFGLHNDSSLQLHALDLNSCAVESVDLLLVFGDLKLNDVEGLAWPSQVCQPH